MDSAAVERIPIGPRLWNAAKVILALGLSAFLLSRVDFAALGDLRGRISPAWLVLSAMVFYASTWSMARRYWHLLEKRLPFREVLRLVAVQTVVSNSVATSAGAVSYVTLLRAKQVRMTQSIASLILSRMLDGGLLAVALLASSAVSWERIPTLHGWILALIALGLAAAGLFMALLVLLPRMGSGTGFSAQFRTIKPLLETLAPFWSVGPLKSHQWLAMALPMLAYSCLAFGFNFVFFYSFMQLFAVPLDVWGTLLIYAFVQLLGLVPIQVFGGLGTTDVMVMYLYGLFGIGQAAIAPVIVGTRVLFYLVNLTMLLYLPLEARFFHGRVV